jgi:hypothetical protein
MSSFRNGYYLAPNGTLRHCHSPEVTRGPMWHEASNVHPATPLAHHISDAFNVNNAAWARSNVDLTPTEKQILINAAREQHDITATGRNLL